MKGGGSCITPSRLMHCLPVCRCQFWNHIWHMYMPCSRWACGVKGAEQHVTADILMHGLCGLECGSDCGVCACCCCGLLLGVHSGPQLPGILLRLPGPRPAHVQRLRRQAAPRRAQGAAGEPLRMAC